MTTHFSFKLQSKDQIRDQLNLLVENKKVLCKSLNVDSATDFLFGFGLWEGEELIYCISGKTVEKNSKFSNERHNDQVDRMYAEVLNNLDFDGSISFSRSFNPRDWDDVSWMFSPLNKTDVFFTNFRIIINTCIKDINNHSYYIGMVKFYSELRAMASVPDAYYGVDVKLVKTSFSAGTKDWTERIYYFPFYLKFSQQPYELIFFNFGYSNMKENYNQAEEALNSFSKILGSYNDRIKLNLNKLIENNNESVAETQKSVANTELSDDSINQLKQLHELKQAGILTDDEFNLKKKQILGL